MNDHCNAMLYRYVLLWLTVLPLSAPVAFSEPYFAVESGHHCGVCHVNPTGAGLRTEFGNLYGQQLAVRPPDSGEPWRGTLLNRFGVGGNARASARQFNLEGRDDNLEFAVDRLTLYLQANLSQQVDLYLDQQVSPGGSLNREAWMRLKADRVYLKAGKLFLPFGWRLEDDSALIRKATGVNLQNGDNGLELGFAGEQLNVQVAVTNGTGGAAEVDDGKLVSARIEWLQPAWRFGASGLANNTDQGERTIYGMFAGLKTGPVTWLFEYDSIMEEGFSTDDRDQGVAFLEANIRFRKGHNVKLTFEGQTFDDATEDHYRNSLVYEYSPFAFTQLRLGLRVGDSDDPAPVLNSEEFFLQSHVFF